MTEKDISAAPVARWEIRGVGPMKIALLTFHYLASPMESLEQAHASPNFALTTEQLRALAETLLRAATSVESHGETTGGHPKH